MTDRMMLDDLVCNRSCKMPVISYPNLVFGFRHIPNLKYLVWKLRCFYFPNRNKYMVLCVNYWAIYTVPSFSGRRDQKCYGYTPSWFWIFRLQYRWRKAMCGKFRKICTSILCHWLIVFPVSAHNCQGLVKEIKRVFVKGFS